MLFAALKYICTMSNLTIILNKIQKCLSVALLCQENKCLHHRYHCSPYNDCPKNQLNCQRKRQHSNISIQGRKEINFCQKHASRQKSARQIQNSELLYNSIGNTAISMQWQNTSTHLHNTNSVNITNPFQYNYFALNNKNIQFTKSLTEKVQGTSNSSNVNIKGANSCTSWSTHAISK